MKRVIHILLGYAIFCLAACFVYSFFLADIPLLLAKSVTLYKIFGALKLFCAIFPAIIITGFVLGYTISFGRNPDGSEARFSPAMFKRYRHVLLVSLGCALLLTAASEIGTPIFEAKQRQYERMPVLVDEYVRIGQSMQKAGRSELAYQYGELAAKIDPASEAAARLMSETEVVARGVRDVASEKETTMQMHKVSEEGFTISELRRKAEASYAAHSWFDAHYYAQTGVSIATPRDTNYERLQEIAAHAWNELSKSAMPAMTDAERLFAKKMSGYSALMQNDNLKAYYVFNELFAEFPRDPDIVRYFELASMRLETETFFIDEILDAKEFETATDVYFSLKKNDGATDIVYVKGVTPVRDTAGMVQYLRGLSIFSLDSNGTYVSSMFVQYAKMLEIQTANFDNLTKRSLGIDDDVAYVPYILLRSVDRNTEGVANEPLYRFASGNENIVRDQLVLPISYDDFLQLCEVSYGAEYVSIPSLFRFINKAKQYGYSEEVFAQVLLNRTLYPLFMVIILLAFATFAWNYRIGERLLFRTSWIVVFPFFSVLAHIMCMMLLWLYKLINYVFIGVAGINFALVLGAFVYVVILIIVSLVFLARNAVDQA